MYHGHIWFQTFPILAYKGVKLSHEKRSPSLFKIVLTLNSPRQSSPLQIENISLQENIGDEKEMKYFDVDVQAVS